MLAFHSEDLQGNGKVKGDLQDFIYSNQMLKSATMYPFKCGQDIAYSN
jgi:hypothetical protein